MLRVLFKQGSLTLFVALARVASAVALMVIFSSLLMGCSEKNLTNVLGSVSESEKGTESISGRMVLESATSSVSAACGESAKASLYTLKSGGGIGVLIASADVSTATGKFVFSVKGKSGFSAEDISQIRYLIQIESCSGDLLARPVTGAADQDVNVASTLLSYALTAPASVGSLSTQMSSTAVSSLLRSIGEKSPSTVDVAFNNLLADLSLSARFESTIGISVEALMNSAPLVQITTPTVLRGKETEPMVFSVSVKHWRAGYSKAVLWSMDGVAAGTSDSFTYTPSKNAQGNHALTVTVGHSNGAGGVDSSKAKFSKVIQFKVDDTYRATPLAFTMTAPVAGVTATTRPITLSIETGASLVNCDTFSKFLITEDDPVPPITSTNFATACTTSGTQTYAHRLGGVNGPKVLRMWVIDSAGNVSLTPSQLTISLEAIVPTLAIVSPSANARFNQAGSAAIAVSGTCSAEARAVTVSSLPAGASKVVTCTAGVWSTAVDLSSFAEGSIKLVVTHSNSDEMVAATTVTVFKDLTAPSVTMSAPTTASIVSSASQAAFPVSGTCSDVGGTVVVTVPATAVSASTTCAGALMWSTTLDLSTIADGALSILATHSDIAGNPGTATVALSKDTRVPSLTVDPLYRGSDVVSLAVVGSSGITSLKLQYAADGVTFSDVSTESGTATSFSWTVPNISAALTPKLRLVSTDQLSATSTWTSSVFSIVTVADVFSGTANGEGNTDGGPLTAKFSGPNGMTKMGSAVYIATPGTVRKVDLTDPAQPIVTTIAGAFGTLATVDGVGSAANFRNLISLTNDGTYLYGTDGTHHVIRKIDPATGTVTTLAGQVGVSGTADGVGSLATFAAPWGIVYAGGYLYVSSGLLIRRVDPTTGAVTTYAGSTGGYNNHASDPLLAKFGSARGLATDGSKLYVMDPSYNQIRSINLSTGETLTLAGVVNGLGWIDGDGLTQATIPSPYGMTYHAGSLFFGDISSHTIRKLDLGTGVMSTIAGTPGAVGDSDGLVGTAKMFRPLFSVSVAADELWVSDAYNHKIYKLTPSTGNIASFLGQTSAQSAANRVLSGARMFGPRGPLVVGNDLYFTESLSGQIRKLDLTTRAISWIAGVTGYPGYVDGANTLARFVGASGIAKVGDDFYIADERCVRRIDISLVVSTIAGSCSAGGNVPSAGTTVAGSTARFSGLRGIVAVGDFLYLVDYSNHKIRKIDVSNPAAPLVSTFAGSTTGNVDATGTSAKFKNPIAIAYNGSDFFVVDYGNNIIRKITPAGEVTMLAGTAGVYGHADGIGSAAVFNFAYGIAADANYVYVGDLNNYRIRRIQISTAEVVTIAGKGTSGAQDGVGASATFDHLGFLALSGTKLYVADYDQAIIRLVDLTDNSVSTIAGAVGQNGTVDGAPPDAVPRYTGLVRVGGFTYTVDVASQVVWRIDNTTGVSSIYAGKYQTPGFTNGTRLSARFNGPNGIVHLAGALYITDRFNHAIRKIDLATETVSLVAGSIGEIGSADGVGALAKFNEPRAIATDGADLYVGDLYNYLIRKVSLPSGAVTTIIGTTGVSGSADGVGLSASIGTPLRFTYLNGSLYAGDTTFKTIRKFDLATNQVTTIAGTVSISGSSDGVGSAALFADPNAITNDGRYLYVVDRSNYTIRRVDPTSGEVMTWWGQSGKRGFVGGSATTTIFGDMVNGIAYDAGTFTIVGDPGSLFRIR